MLIGQTATDKHPQERKEGRAPWPVPGLTGQTPAVQGLPRFELASNVKEPSGGVGRAGRMPAVPGSGIAGLSPP